MPKPGKQERKSACDIRPPSLSKRSKWPIQWWTALFPRSQTAVKRYKNQLLVPNCLTLLFLNSHSNQISLHPLRSPKSAHFICTSISQTFFCTMSVKGRIANYYAKKSKVAEFLWNCAQVSKGVRRSPKGCRDIVYCLQHLCSLHLSREQCDGSSYEDLRYLCDLLNGIHVHLQNPEIQSCEMSFVLVTCS